MDFFKDIAQSPISPTFLQKHLPWLDTPLFMLGETPITTYNILQFVIIIFLAYLLASFVRRWVRRLVEKRKHIQPKTANNLSKTAFYFIFIMGLFFAMTTVGLNFTSLAVVAGALSVGIGFGFQSVVQNIAAGIFLLLEKHIRIDHIIQLESGQTGKVMAIRLRTTVLRTFENTAVLVPNAEMISKKVINFSLIKDKRRLLLPFSVAFGSDKKKMTEALVKEVKKVPYTAANTQPNVWLIKIGDSGLEYQLAVIIELKGAFLAEIKSTYFNLIEDVLKQNQIEIPYPVRDVRMKQKALS